MGTTIIQSPPFIPTPHHIYDDDETLSLRDLPLTTTTSTSTVDHHPSTSPSPSRHHNQTNNNRRSSSDPTSDFFFEFLINNDDDLITSSADDVIFRGRLLPFTPPPQQQPQSSLPRRSLSLSSRITRGQLTESSSSPPPAIRPSKSLNYRKLHRSQRSYSKPKPEFLRRTSCNNNSSNNSEKMLPAKSPWSWLIFGLPKIPAEMELKDIKNRQFKRNLTSLNSRDNNNSNSNNKSCSSASWKFLNVLSCKSHATIDVSNTAPFRNSLI